MVITEVELREMWGSGGGKIPSFPEGTRFTPSALDFLQANHIPVVIYTNSSSPSPAWDKASVFPVHFEETSPVCDTCAQPATHKPDDLTQLDQTHFSKKNHPRIHLRGRLDSLQAVLLLAARTAARQNATTITGMIDTLTAYCREILSAEYNNRPVAQLSFAGMDEDKIHAISQKPDQYLGIHHLTPNATTSDVLPWLNLARTTCREIELTAMVPGIDRPDLVHALNRLSSAVYVIELIQSKTEQQAAETLK